MMGKSFRRWRSELNMKYIQNGLTPFNEFGKITPSQWEELVAQKTSPEALELSARNTKLVKRNKHHHHCNTLGITLYCFVKTQHEHHTCLYLCVNWSINQYTSLDTFI